LDPLRVAGVDGREPSPETSAAAEFRGIPVNPEIKLYVPGTH
jgi:hypothetical protein